VSRPFGYLGILVAAAITLRAAIHRTLSTLFAILMTLAIASAVATLWYSAQIFKTIY
jgi:hypothetical protein